MKKIIIIIVIGLLITSFSGCKKLLRDCWNCQQFGPGQIHEIKVCDKTYKEIEQWAKDYEKSTGYPITGCIRD